MTQDRAPDRVLVVGAGLIGTSVGLALQGVADVQLTDADSAHLAAAIDRGAGRQWDGSGVDLALVCAPPAVTPVLVTGLLRSDAARTVSQVSSVQAHVQAEVETGLMTMTGAAARYCGGHPLAGRETRGPSAASARLFADRPWVVCPTPVTGAAALADVRWLASACGAVPVELPATEHDRQVALTSHLVQIAASAVAAQLGASGSSLDLAGQGLQDTTRVAASDPALWREILTLNAGNVAPLLHALATDLADAARALGVLAHDPADGAAADVVVDLLRRGNEGRARLPLKQHAQGSEFAAVAVSVPDRPGQLAAVLSAAAAAGINVEDVRVEHLPGRPRGLLELLVAADQAEAARAALVADGWDVAGS